MSDVYLHQILSGKRHPSRNRLLALCLGMGSRVKETQELLKQSGEAVLYPKIWFDAVVLYGLMRQMDLQVLRGPWPRQEKFKGSADQRSHQEKSVHNCCTV